MRNGDSNQLLHECDGCARGDCSTSSEHGRMLPEGVSHKKWLLSPFPPFPVPFPVSQEPASYAGPSNYCWASDNGRLPLQRRQVRRRFLGALMRACLEAH